MPRRQACLHAPGSINNVSRLQRMNTSMATSSPFLAQLSRICLSSRRQTIVRLPATLWGSITQIRHKHGEPRILSKAEKLGQLKKPTQANRMKDKKEDSKKRRKPRTTYKQYDLKDTDQFSLCEAMRYLRAFEVGRKPTESKYEMHIKLKSLKNGPVIRNRLRLPHPVKTDLRICVICPPDSKYAETARAAGAALVGEDDIFEAVKDGRIEFDRILCQTDSLAKMNKAGLGRILGPRGLMPSTKLGTVVKDPGLVIKDLVGGAEYKERLGVIRMAVGQLGFTPEEMQRNIKIFIEALKKDIAQMSDRIHKEIVEVVLSSTHGPGFTLSGEFQNPQSNITPRELSS